MQSTTNTYRVKFIDKPLVITGNGDSPLWENAEILDQFVSPWNAEKTPKIQFRSLWDNSSLYFCFTVFDSLVHINNNDNSVYSIGESDRVELFFRKDKNLNPYYCLEIDASARIMDFKAHPNKEFDFNWNWPEDGLVVKSFISDDYFIVEGAISIASLKELDLVQNGKIDTGIFRAKYIKKAGGKGYEPTWITWVNPNTNSPNFHISDSFGQLLLVLKTTEEANNNEPISSTDANRIFAESVK
jgi:hypothetical protein